MNLRIVYTRLLTPDGSKMTIGGIQTYLQSLASVASGVGLRPVLYQCAAQAFTRQVGGIEIRGIVTGGVNTTERGKRIVSAAAMSDARARNDIVVFGTDGFSVPTGYPRAVLIQHGISWDKPEEPGRFASLDKARWVRSLRLARRHQIFRSYFENCRNRVCVDYNFQNWYRTFEPGANGGRTWVIPNFTPIPDELAVQRKFTAGLDAPVRILFARRFETYRGTRLMGEAASRLLKEFPQVRFTFAGDGPDKPWLVQQFAGESRVSMCMVPYEERMALTLEHDIAVVPTLGSEGTSLSLAEAMASGCAVVATDVGGMTNMVLDGYNGRLIPPSREMLYSAIRQLIVDAGLRRILARRAREVAACSFSEAKWRERWQGVLGEISKIEVNA